MDVKVEDTTGIHPNDPTNSVPKNKFEFKQIVFKGPYQPEFTTYSRILVFSIYLASKKDATYCFPC